MSTKPKSEPTPGVPTDIVIPYFIPISRASQRRPLLVRQSEIPADPDQRLRIRRTQQPIGSRFSVQVHQMRYQLLRTVGRIQG
jgi:hypothetical protein